MRIKAAIIVAVISLSAFNISASHRELELFDQGYEYYLSYRPEKAVEAFTLFIKEFPGSPAREAAMFWMGKSLLHLKLSDDAKSIFRDIKREFPASPFTKYVDKELERLAKGDEVTAAAPVITTEEKKFEPPVVQTRNDEVTDANMGKPLNTLNTIEQSEKQVSQSTKGSEKKEEPERKLSVHEEELAKPSGTDARPNGKGASGETLNISPSLQETGGNNRDLETEVFLFLARYIGAYEGGDIASFIDLFSKSAIQNNSLRYSDIRRSYARNFEGNRYNFTLEDVRIEKKEDPIIVSGDYSIKKITDDDKAARTHGIIQWTLTREEGTLKIVKIDYYLIIGTHPVLGQEKQIPYPPRRTMTE